MNDILVDNQVWNLFSGRMVTIKTLTESNEPMLTKFVSDQQQMEFIIDSVNLGAWVMFSDSVLLGRFLVLWV